MDPDLPSALRSAIEVAYDVSDVNVGDANPQNIQRLLDENVEIIKTIEESLLVDCGLALALLVGQGEATVYEKSLNGAE